MLQQDEKFLPPTSAPQKSVETKPDRVLETLERVKKISIAAFLLSSLLVAVAAVLLFEVGGVVKVWQVEFGSTAQASTLSSHKANACEAPSPPTSIPAQR